MDDDLSTCSVFFRFRFSHIVSSARNNRLLYVYLCFKLVRWNENVFFLIIIVNLFDKTKSSCSLIDQPINLIKNWVKSNIYFYYRLSMSILIIKCIHETMKTAF